MKVHVVHILYNDLEDCLTSYIFGRLHFEPSLASNILNYCEPFSRLSELLSSALYAYVTRKQSDQGS